jgi:hypothetical protein
LLGEIWERGQRTASCCCSPLFPTFAFFLGECWRGWECYPAHADQLMHAEPYKPHS